MKKLYSLLQEKNKNYVLVMEPIIDFDKQISDRPLTLNEKKAMECALIVSCQPQGNTSGIDIPYRFNDSQDIA